MNSITIITIVVIALLTVTIFTLTWLAYISCLKTYRIEVKQGKYDEQIRKEYHTNKKIKGGLVGIICSYTALLALLSLFVTGIVYKANNENFTINNETALVIKSGSMSNFYDDDLAQKYNYDTHLQFDIGDICVFEKVADDVDLVEGEVYGYEQKNITITHRLVKIHFGYLYEFRGDNNAASDVLLVKRNDIRYHYIGRKIPGIGAFILYAQSYFGIWSISGVVGVVISSEVIYYKINKVNKKRYEELEDR